MEPRRRLQDWHHVLLICLIIAVLTAGLVYLFLHVNIVPNPSSVERGYIDHFIKILFSIASFFFSVIIVVLAYSLIFFRRRAGDTTEGAPVRGSVRLERAWTIIPLLIVIALGTYGGIVLDKMTAPGPPLTEMEIDVLAFRFGWQFTYPKYGVTSFELHVPVNQRILIKLQSKDVVHSFWVQEWGPKQDAVPGITTQVRYTPTVIGQFTVRCSQLCGYGHSFMTAPALVTSTQDFQTWIQQQQAKTTTTTTTTTPAPTSPTTTSTTMTFGQLSQLGSTVFADNCAVCHGNNGEGKVGPALIGPNQHLANYGTAQGLFDFISTNMPFSNPGSLTHEQYLDVLSFLLVQNKEVSDNATFNESQLGGITLK
jgi:cytochrome c oxidase subunit 2